MSRDFNFVEAEKELCRIFLDSFLKNVKKKKKQFSN